MSTYLVYKVKKKDGTDIGIGKQLWGYAATAAVASDKLLKCHKKNDYSSIVDIEEAFTRQDDLVPTIGGQILFRSAKLGGGHLRTNIVDSFDLDPASKLFEKAQLLMIAYDYDEYTPLKKGDVVFTTESGSLYVCVKLKDNTIKNEKNNS